jgi:miniconductance mechanosensitive channel
MNEFFLSLFERIGFSDDRAAIIGKIALLLIIFLISFLANLVAKRVIVRLIHGIVRKTRAVWDDIIMERGVLTKLSHLAPALIVYFLIRIPFPENDVVIDIIQRLAIAYIIGVVALTLSSLLNAVLDIYNTHEISKSRPIKGYIQVIKIAVIIIGLILMVTTILDKSPAGILGGIGALSAVLMLVFKDSILGLVASIQLSANNMVKIGDWIEMPKYGANGDVIEITLQSVKVRNWDKTITTIPIYALVNDSFKNWRGMQESGGRRIKRSVNIDMRSISFCTQEMIERFSKIGYLKEYLEKKLEEIEKYNTEMHIEPDDMINGRRLTNIGTFRAYLINYLQRHPKIHKDMTFLVRQLPPARDGLPIEIYVFSSDQAWADYEAIQADIFDHILAVLPVFDLKVYQEPSGWDLQQIAETNLHAAKR